MAKNINIEQFIPELIPIEKSNHEQLNDVKKTIIKMFVNRGFINEKNKEKYTEKLISDENEDMEYIIDLDNDKNYNTEISNKKIYIKFFDYKISSINKSSQINEFLVKHDKVYKLLIIQEINLRIEDIIETYKTQVEIFKFNKLQSDITEHDLVPKHIVLNKEEREAVLTAYLARKRDMPLIRSNDVIAKYYNMKPDDIVKIIRPSPISGEAIAYRYVIKSKVLKVKT